MSSSGAGRGRGWLKKNPGSSGVASSTPQPPGVINPTSPIIQSSPSQSTESRRFTKLLSSLDELNLEDDGILLNEKIKYIMHSWNSSCSDGEEVRQSVDVVYENCLNNSSLATKIVHLMTARNFHEVKIHDQTVKSHFVTNLQMSFENRESLQKYNPTVFRNCVQMTGEFFSKSKTPPGVPYHCMAKPLITYLELLLQAGQPLDLKVFVIQLYLNGSTLKVAASESFSELLNSIRLSLVSTEKTYTKEVKLWFLLALDVANNRFSVLPIDIHIFYEKHLGDMAATTIQDVLCTLSVKTSQTCRTLVGYQSNVNVLQLSTTPDSTSATDPLTSPPKELNSSSNTDYVPDSSQISADQQIYNNSSKHGRPILGAGARFNKTKSNNVEANWRDSDGRTRKPKNTGVATAGWGDSKRGGASRNKAWEHDDRFETDYS